MTNWQEIKTKRRGDWIQTFTGLAFWPLDPRVEEIDPRDIAHALSMLCRYGGHVKRFYSVAEHCVLMSYAVSPENALWALLHDATEAYLMDLPRPIKKNMPTYSTAENALMLVICERFGLDPNEPEEISNADSSIVLDEKRVLLEPSPFFWPEETSVVPLEIEIYGWSPYNAEHQYAHRLNELITL